MHDEKTPSPPPRDEAIALPELEDENAAKIHAQTWRQHITIMPREFWEWGRKRGAESFDDAVQQWADETELILGKVISPGDRESMVWHLSNTVRIPHEPWRVDALDIPGEFRVRGCSKEMARHVHGLVASAPKLLRLLEQTLLGNDPEAQKEAFELVMRYRRLLE